MLEDFIVGNNLLSLDTHFQKKASHQWTHESPNKHLSQFVTS